MRSIAELALQTAVGATNDPKEPWITISVFRRVLPGLFAIQLQHFDVPVRFLRVDSETEYATLAHKPQAVSLLHGLKYAASMRVCFGVDQRYRDVHLAGVWAINTPIDQPGIVHLEVGSVYTAAA